MYSFSMSRASQMANNCFTRKTPPLSVMRRCGAPNCSKAAYRTMSTHARSWRRSDIAGENRSREGIHDGNHVKRTLDFRDAMFFDVADIDAPSLMASSRLERVKLWLVWLFWGRLDAIELTILGHNAATGSRGNRNPELLERGIHAKLTEQRIFLLLLANQVARRQIDAWVAGIGV